jgi:CubicO group peptidase (beta-lactamase class C family)
MKKTCLLFYLLVSFLAIKAQDITKQLNEYISGSKKNNYFNGTVLVVQKDSTLLYKSSGYRDAGATAVNDTNTIYRIGSLSKPFTATVILKLAENNALTLQDKLSKYVPGFPHGDSITIEHLLTHSSGIKDYLEVKAVQQLTDDAPPVSIDTLIGYFKDEPLTMRPGEKFSYSNSNYILLAYIIEKTTGEKFEHAVRQYIFEPLQMNHSGFDFKNLLNSNKSMGFNSLKHNYTDTIIDFDSTYAPGCGSMYTTAMDLYKFYKGLYRGLIIRDSTRDQMFIPRKWKYGYGWFAYTLYGKKCISHAGGVPGFYANLQFFPDDDVFIALLSNCSIGHIETDKIAAIVFGKKLERSGL